MKVVILSGGEGMRMRDYPQRVPKALVDVGGKPLIWHVMSIYAAQGFDDFIIATGYMSEKIAKWTETSDFPGRVKTIFTGVPTPTGGRIKALANQGVLGDEPFLCTYCDGLSNIDLLRLLETHRQGNRIATVTVVRPKIQFGVLKVFNDEVIAFEEKPVSQDLVNGGFFVLEPRIFDLLNMDSDFERQTLPLLVEKKQLTAFEWRGFWRQADNLKDVAILNVAWDTSRPWAVWETNDTKYTKSC